MMEMEFGVGVLVCCLLLLLLLVVWCWCCVHAEAIGGLFVCDCAVILMSIALSHSLAHSSSISKFKMGEMRNEERGSCASQRLRQYCLSVSIQRQCHNEPRGLFGGKLTTTLFGGRDEG
jgi:hypothetical protein